MEKQQELGQMPASDKKDQLNNRPGCITALSIFGFIVTGLIVIGSIFIFTTPDLLRYIIPFAPLIPVLLVVILFMVITYVGLWRMKRYGVILYTISAGISILFSLNSLFSSGFNSRYLVSGVTGSILGLGVSIAILVYLWKNYSKMS